MGRRAGNRGGDGRSRDPLPFPFPFPTVAGRPKAWAHFDVVDVARSRSRSRNGNGNGNEARSGGVDLANGRRATPLGVALQVSSRVGGPAGFSLQSFESSRQLLRVPLPARDAFLPWG